MRQIEQTLLLSDEERRLAKSRHKFFSKEEQQVFDHVYEELQRIQNPNYYQKREQMEQLFVITLGQEVDVLQEDYLEKGEYLKAYSVDCIATELLKKFYEKIQETLQKEGFFIEKFLYPGEQIPLEEIRRIFQKTAPKEVTYNESYFLSPKKSVAMIALLTKEKQTACKTICEQCSQKNCPSREERREKKEKPYGYQRIFTK